MVANEQIAFISDVVDAVAGLQASLPQPGVIIPQTEFFFVTSKGLRYILSMNDNGDLQKSPPTVNSSVIGAGFQNVAVIADTNVHPPTWLVGGDVSGVARSVDLGLSWSIRDEIITQVEHHTVAVAFHAVRANEAYQYSSNGTVSSFFMSLDGGSSWQRQAGTLAFGARTGGNLHPRQVGRMIAHDETNTNAVNQKIWLGSSNGIWRSINRGIAWGSTPFCLAGLNVTSISIDKVNSNIMYATVDDVSGRSNAGLYMITGITGSSPTVFRYPPIVGSPTTYMTDAQECIARIDPAGASVVFIAAGGAKGSSGGQLPADGTGTPVADAVYPGIWKYVPAVDGSNKPIAGSAGAFTNLTSSATGAVMPTDWFRWSAIDARLNGSTMAIVAGAALITTATPDAAPYTDGAHNYRTVWRSDDAGVTWRSLTDGTAVNTNIYGPGGAVWWLLAAKGAYALNKSAFDVSAITFDPNDLNTILLAGRSAPWLTTDGGVNWFPIPNGIGAVGVFGVAIDPNNPARVLTTTADWTGLVSQSNFLDSQPVFVGPNGGGFACYIDDASQAYISMGNPNNSGGRVVSSPSGWISQTNTGFGSTGPGVGSDWGLEIPAGGLAQITNSVTNSLTFTVNTAGSLTVGMKIDIADTQGSLIVASATISAISGTTITIDSLISTYTSPTILVYTARGSCQGVIAAYDGTGTRILLAWFNQATGLTGGLYRKVGAGTPSRVLDLSASLPAGLAGYAASFVRAPGSGVFFVSICNKGLYRSIDYGATWSLIWQYDITGRPDSAYIGQLAYGDNDILYMTLVQAGVLGLYAIAQASTAVANSPTTNAPVSGDQSGNTAVTLLPYPSDAPTTLDFDFSNSMLYVSNSVFGTSGQPALYRTQDDATFTYLGDVGFENAAGSAVTMAVTQGGKILYTGTDGDGLLVTKLDVPLYPPPRIPGG